METVSVGSIMERDAYSCSAQATLKDVTKSLINRGVSSLPVVDDDNHVVGFISDGDIMRAIAEHKTRSIFSGGAPTRLYYDDETIEQKVLSLRERNVMELATRKVLCVTENQSVGRVADTLAKKKFKKLPVIDEHGRLVGVIRRSSIMRYVFDLLFHDNENKKQDE